VDLKQDCLYGNSPRNEKKEGRGSMLERTLNKFGGGEALLQVHGERGGDWPLRKMRPL